MTYQLRLTGVWIGVEKLAGQLPTPKHRVSLQRTRPSGIETHACRFVNKFHGLNVIPSAARGQARVKAP